MLCTACKTQAHTHDGALRDWENEFNRILEPGVFCKLQSKAERVVNMTGQVSDQAKVTRWVAFAYTDESIRRLKMDPHVTGKTPDYSACCGFNAKDLAMHPGDFSEL